MKLNNFFLAAFATLALFASCTEDNPVNQEASLKIEGESSFDLDSKAQTVTVSIESNRDWSTKTSASWIAVNPDHGTASSSAQEVEITVMENTSYDRSATVTFSIGVLSKTVTINQKGNGASPDGTKENPFNAAAANKQCIEVGQTASTEDYYVKGIISKNLNIEPSYGNATFYISDDGTTTSEQFYVFRCYYIGGEKFASTDQLKIGDEVVVKGKLINYNGKTPEMNSGGEIVSVNGGTEVSDYLSISKASAEVSAAAGSIELSVTSNTTWTASCSESFVTLSATSGEGNGTVTVSYAENTAAEARSASVTFEGAGKTVTFTLNQLEAGAAAARELTWTNADWTGAETADISWTDGTYTVEVHKNSGSTNPAVRNNGDIRAYAKATIVVSGPAMSSIAIVLASDGGYRYTTVTADCGEVAAQAEGDTEVRWSGSSETVSFTVGDYATLGSDGASKGGQIRFCKIIVK